MNKTELIRCVAERLPDIPDRDVKQAITVLFEQLASTLAAGGRCEVRGFGVFSIHTLQARVARNPKTGDSLRIPEKQTPHFKPGKLLKEKVALGQLEHPIRD